MATTFSAAMREPARELAIRGALTFPSGAVRALSGDEIMAYSLSEGTNDGLLPGAVLSASHTLELANADGEWLEGGRLRGEQVLEGATVQLELGARLEDASFAWEPLGVFVVREASGAEGGARIALTGSDSIGSELYAQYRDALAYPATLQQIWDQAVGQTRYVWSGAVPNGGAIVDRKPDWKGGSVRQAMAAAAMAAGCFVRVSRAGALELVPAWREAAEPTAVNAETYLSLTQQAARFGPVAALQVAPMRADGAAEDPADVTVRTGSGVVPGSQNTVRIENNVLFAGGAAHLNALMQGTLSALAGLTQRAASFRWRGDPTLRIGDRVRVTDRRGRTTETVVLRQTLRFEAGFSAEIGCDVREADLSGVPRAITPEGGVNANLLVGTVDGALLAVESVTARSIAAQAVTAEKIAALSIGAEKLQAGSVTADKLEAVSVNAAVLQAVTARIQQLAAGELTTDQLYAALAQIAGAEIGRAAIGSAQILEAAVGTAQIADAAITRAKLGSAAVGTAQIALGAITTALIATGAVGTLQIADGSITDAKIVALTADKINAGTLAAERLLLRGEGGLFYEINAQAGGLTAAQLTEAQYRNAISGTALVARSVTAEKIAARTITANELAANTITAAEIDVAQLFAAEATVAAINAMDIRGNAFLKLGVRAELDGLQLGGRNYIPASRAFIQEGMHGFVSREKRAVVGGAVVGRATAG